MKAAPIALKVPETPAPARVESAKRQSIQIIFDDEEIESSEFKDILDASMSYFANVTDTEPCSKTTLRELLERIKSDADKELVDEIRQTSDKGERTRLKKQLSCVTVSGTVTTGGRAKAHCDGRFLANGLVACDFDAEDFPERTAEDVRALLRADKYVQAVFMSPSGGMKAIIRIPTCASPEEFERAFRAAETYFWENHGLKIDSSTKDSVRLTFLSHDPNAWLRQCAADVLKVSSVILDFSKPAPEKSEPQQKAHGRKQSSGRRWSANEISEMLSHIPARPPYDVWIKIIAAVSSEVDEASAVLLLQEWSPEENQGEYLEKIRSVLDQISIGTLIHLARENGYETPPRAPSKRVVFDRAAFEAWGTKTNEHAMEGSNISAEFPLHCLPDIAGKMAREIARVTTSRNVPLAAVSILGALSASIGAGLEISTGGGRRSRGNLFIGAIADSGTGKTEALKPAFETFEDAEAKAVEHFNKHVKPGLVAELKVSELTAKKLCSKAAGEPRPGSPALTDYKRTEENLAALRKKLESPPHWKVADATKEALAVILQGQPGEALASVSSEGRGIFSIVKGRYSKAGGDEDIYCAAYSGDSITVDRIGSELAPEVRPLMG